MSHHGSGVALAVVGPRELEAILGWASESISGVAWMILQEEARGVERLALQKMLGVDADDIQSLIQETTGKDTWEEAKESWNQGLISLKTSAVLNKTAIGTSWDAIESMATEKLARTLADMKTNGSAMDMLEIATRANKAHRRDEGEPGRGGGQGRGIGMPGIDITLDSGNLGTIRFQLSPKIQQQIANPARVIDGVSSRIKDVTANETSKLEMLDLGSTRNLALRQDAADRGESANEVYNFESLEELLNATKLDDSNE